MKRILLSAVLLSSIGLNAQVGINTTEPEATLDVNGNLRVQSASESKIPSNENCPCFLVVDEKGEVKRVPIGKGTGIGTGTTGSDGTTVIGGVSPVDGGVANPSVLTPDVVEIGWNTYQSNFSKVEIAVNLQEGVPYSAYMSPPVSLPTIDGKERRISIMYPKGVTDDTGKITATLLFDGDHTYAPQLILESSEEKTYKVPLYFNGIKQDNDLVLHAGINAVKNTEHGQVFTYPIIKMGDMTVMAMNLGAEYAKEATSNPAVLKTWRENKEWQTDYKAYGSLFQWGRSADGHELMTWTSSTSGTPTNPDVEWKSNNELSMTGSQWACPSGWHVPTYDQLRRLMVEAGRVSSTATNSSTIWKNEYIRVAAGGMLTKTRSLTGTGSRALLWSSENSIYPQEALSAAVKNGSLDYSNTERSNGLSLRCIED